MAEIPKPRSQTQVRQLHALETFAFNIAPQTDAGAPVWVKAKSIHPSLSKSNATTRGWRKIFFGER